jgi:deoxycytidylate deaminase
VRPDWDDRYMRLIMGEPLTWSSIPGKEGGAACLLVSPDNRELSIGYAGLPRDANPGLVSLCGEDPRFRDIYCRHAERNALSNAARDVAGWTAYVTAPPCLQCAIELHARRIARVVSSPLRPGSRWKGECDEARAFLILHDVECETWDPRRPCGAGSSEASPPSMFGATYTG